MLSLTQEASAMENVLADVESYIPEENRETVREYLLSVPGQKPEEKHKVFSSLKAAVRSYVAIRGSTGMSVRELLDYAIKSCGGTLPRASYAPLAIGYVTPGMRTRARKGNWKITAFEKSFTKEYGPYKIRTNAWRWVDVWELAENKKKRLEWRLKRDSNGNIIKAKDSGLLIHGGGWSESALDNKKGTNKYTDTTLGCIRISNLDVCLIEKTLNAYLNIKKIDLEVK